MIILNCTFYLIYFKLHFSLNSIWICGKATPQDSDLFIKSFVIDSVS